MDNPRRRPLQVGRKTVKVVTQIEWLPYLIGITRMIGDLAPFPVLSGVASIVLLILEPLEASIRRGSAFVSYSFFPQTLKHNRHLFKDLAEKVVRIIVYLRNEVLADEFVAASIRFVQTCNEFSEPCCVRPGADIPKLPAQRASGSQRNSAAARQKLGGSLATAVGTRLRIHLIHADLTSIKSALAAASLNAGAEPQFSDFHKLIPGDLQLIPPVGRVPSAEVQENPVEYPVLVRGVRMTARLYYGEKALEESVDDSVVRILRITPSTCSGVPSR
ncbi:hypothetical protein K438DRAFT_1772082 [Mycena galopus ATCC 62051]|nr:hypothetical protein K438DRAFT_1772082 [Mycena galopus ATCC 62051]